MATIVKLKEEEMTKIGICILCKEEGVELTEHHCTNKKENIIMICQRCHKLINEGGVEP